MAALQRLQGMLRFGRSRAWQKIRSNNNTNFKTRTRIIALGLFGGVMTPVQLAKETVVGSNRIKGDYMRICRVFLVTLMGCAALLSGQSSVASSQEREGCHVSALPNVNQLALLRWYGANVVTTFMIGGRPNGIAFDGQNMWVVGGPANSVSKIRANDGAPQGTFPVGNLPGYAAFDGENVWVTNLLDNTVSKLRAADGANLGTFPTGKFPWVIAFDGSSIWVVDILDNAVSKLRPSDGATLGIFPAGPNPIGIAFDGQNIWLADQGGAGNTVTKLRASDGVLLGTFNVGENPVGVTFDGTSI